MLSTPDLIELVNDTLYPAFLLERARLDEIDKWYRWNQDDIVAPKGATKEHKALLQIAKTPWLGLVVTNVAQALYVDGYFTPESSDDELTSTPWELWNSNDLDGRQGAIHRAALAYGQSYATALPGRKPDGTKTAVLRGVSPRKMLAFYADPAEDDWPVYVIRVDGVGDKRKIRVYDNEVIYTLSSDAGTVTLDGAGAHEVGVCPVVRYSNMLDLDGRTDGEVEPFIPLAKRIDKTTYDRLLVQHFNSWKVRTVSGMAEPDTDLEKNLAKLRLAHDSILVSDSPDTKFDTLAETSMDGFIKAHETDIKTLAAATQTPVHSLVGDLINLSADAIAAARASLDAKVGERQKPFGKSHGQLLRTGAHIVGDEAAAADVFARPTWQDTSIRSLGAAADALGKIATMLGVPVEALWPRIPGVTKTDVIAWKQLAEEPDELTKLAARLNAAAVPAA